MTCTHCGRQRTRKSEREAEAREIAREKGWVRCGECDSFIVCSECRVHLRKLHAEQHTKEKGRRTLPGIAHEFGECFCGGVGESVIDVLAEFCFSDRETAFSLKMQLLDEPSTASRIRVGNLQTMREQNVRKGGKGEKRIKFFYFHRKYSPNIDRDPSSVRSIVSQSGSIKSPNKVEGSDLSMA